MKLPHLIPLLLFSIGIIAKPNLRDSTDIWIKMGKEAMEQNRLLEAAHYFRKAKSESPLAEDLLFDTYLKSLQFEKILQKPSVNRVDSGQLVASTPVKIEWTEPDTAVEQSYTYFEKALALNAADAAAHAGLGKLYYRDGNYEKARAHLFEHIRLRPTATNAYLLLEDLFLKNEKYEAAEIALLRYAKYHPDEPQAYLRLGRLYDKWRIHSRAEENYRHVINPAQAYDSTFVEFAYERLSQSLAKRQDFKMQEFVIAEWQNRFPKRLDYKIEFYKTMAALQTDEVYYPYQLGLILLDHRLYKSAVNWLLRAEDIAQSNTAKTNLYIHLAKAYTALNDTGKALSALRYLRNKKSDNIDYALQAVDILRREEDHLAAKEILEGLDTSNLLDYHYYNILTDYYLTNGNWEKAAPRIEKLLYWHPEPQVEALRASAKYYYLTKNYEAAKDAWFEVIKADHQDVAGYYMMALCHIGLGQFDKAQEWLWECTRKGYTPRKIFRYDPRLQVLDDTEWQKYLRQLPND